MRDEEVDHRQPRLPAVPLPRDLERRHGRPHDARSASMPKTGFSDFDKKPVEVFYGTERPGPALPAGIHVGESRTKARAASHGRRLAGFLVFAVIHRLEKVGVSSQVPDPGALRPIPGTP